MRLEVTAAEHTNCPRHLSRLAILLVLALLLGAAPGVAAAQTVTVVQTTANLHDALTVQAPQAFVAQRAPRSTVIRVDSSIRYQTITGFGGAMTDTSAWLLYDELTPAGRAATLAALFGPSGINLNFVRIPIGASDYTVSPFPYSYDDQPSGQTDPALSDFSIAHDEAYIIPALLQVLRVNPRLLTLASPWSPPTWMKANASYDNNGLAGWVLPKDYSALARYFVKFIQAYQAAGVPIDAITPMNEPSCSCTWPGARLSSADDATFLPQYLAPALGAAGLHPTVFGVDDTELSDAQALLSGPAAPTLGGIAFHCYKGMGQMSALHEAYPSEQIVLSECSPGIIPYATGEVPIDATRNWASAVQLWNLALDPAGGPYETLWGCPGCTGLVTVDERTQTPSFGLNYFQFGQTTKYVQPGAVRIFSTRNVSDGYGISRGVDNVAFVNPDGSKVLVAYNNRGRAARLAVRWHGRYLNWRLPGRATVTLIWH
jgi:glucosylceramidase